MPLLNTADRVYLGNAVAGAVYAGSTQVWPANAASYAAFDPVTALNVELKSGNRTLINTASGSTDQGAHTLIGKTAGKFYYEVTLVNWATGGSVGIGGVGTITSSFYDMQNGAIGGVMLQSAGGQIWVNFTVPFSLGSRANGDVIGFAVNLDDRMFWCRVVSPSIGDWNGSKGARPADIPSGIPLPAGGLAPFCTFGGVSTVPGNRVMTNFGSRSFIVGPPVDYTAGLTL